jgi:hypothetical protein
MGRPPTIFGHERSRGRSRPGSTRGAQCTLHADARQNPNPGADPRASKRLWPPPASNKNLIGATVFEPGRPTNAVVWRHDRIGRHRASATRFVPSLFPRRAANCPPGTANTADLQLFPSIGETGFEPATARPPAGCATRLRHSPWPCIEPTPWERSERATGIEPALKAWKAFVQPQHFARVPRPHLTGAFGVFVWARAPSSLVGASSPFPSLNRNLT